MDLKDRTQCEEDSGLKIKDTIQPPSKARANLATDDLIEVISVDVHANDDDSFSSRDEAVPEIPQAQVYLNSEFLTNQQQLMQLPIQTTP